MFDLFVLVWICRFPLPLDVWEGLRFVIVALPGLFSYLFFKCASNTTEFLSQTSDFPLICSLKVLKLCENIKDAF